MKKKAILMFLLLIFAVFVLITQKGEAGKDEQSGPQVKEAQKIGSSACKECHTDVKDSKIYGYHSDCESCHGEGSIHASSPEKENIALPQSGDCLTCHQKDSKRMNWKFSSHHKAGVNCRDCHEVHVSKTAKASHAGINKMDKKSASCVKCHQDVIARFNMTSHHPVKEGGLSCSNCHDPHGSKEVTLLSKNDQCFKCHQSIRGPKVFEHAPVVEDCTICHNPHGSPNRRLLETAQPVLCLQCHSVADKRHAQGGTANARISGAVLRGCVNCHGSIHGSHQDPHLRY